VSLFPARLDPYLKQEHRGVVVCQPADCGGAPAWLHLKPSAGEQMTAGTRGALGGTKQARSD
jgi:hypothetical protein